MRFPLIGEAHGQLGVVNELAARTQPEAVIHAGNFGPAGDGSWHRDTRIRHHRVRYQAASRPAVRRMGTQAGAKASECV